MINAKDIFQLRKSGRLEDAYEAARKLYAVDKGHDASMAMFWTAVDMIRKKVNEEQIHEAEKIYYAAERLVKTRDDKSPVMLEALKTSFSFIQKRKNTNVCSDGLSENIVMGRWGEDIAAAYLQEKGFVILERDWHSGHRDIDIIAQKGEWIVFVEVKTRKNRDFGEPEEAVNYEKLRNLRYAINHYIKYRRIDNPCRLDVITVVGSVNTESPEINHIEDFRFM